MELQKPSDEDACQLLHGLAPKYEKHLNEMPNYGNGIFGENGNDSSDESEYDADEDMAKITAGLIMTACAMAHLPQAGDS